MDPQPGSFGEIEGLVNMQFENAIVSNSFGGDLYRFFLLRQQLDAPHPLAVFCVANTVEPLGPVAPEQIRLAVPVTSLDMHMPSSVLGKDAHYFYATYRMARGGIRAIEVNPRTYERRFVQSERPPILDFAHKLLSFTVLPLRER